MDVPGRIQKTTLLVKVFIWEWRVGEKSRKEFVAPSANRTRWSFGRKLARAAPPVRTKTTF